MVNDSDYLKRHEYLAFDKNTALKLATPKLRINAAKNEFQFTSSNGSANQKSFRRNTSEFQILMYLIDNHRIPVETGELIKKLKPRRKNTKYADPKQRVIDKITAIRKSLGTEVISTTPNGYIIECEILRI